jgi:GntR family transcriptional regulator/MocR family aminotransferase
MTQPRASFIPPIDLDFRSKTPLYRQISVWFQRAILAGQLRPGQRVPSTRLLAQELRISRIPVLSAYELLIAEGYFQPRVGAGTRVSESIPDTIFRRRQCGTASTEDAAIRSTTNRVISRRASAMAGPVQDWLNACSGCTDIEHFPVGIWAKLVSRHARKVSREVMGYGRPMGFGPFRDAISEYLGAFRAVKCDPSQIMVTTGAQQGLVMAAMTLLDPGDAVWVEEPAYPAAHQALRTVGARLVPVPVDREGLRVERGIHAATSARAAFVTPSHHYPLSVTMSAARRIELLDWAARNGSWIIEDDYDSEYRFSGNSIASLQGLDGDSRVIFVGSLNKVMFPALRLGFVVLPRDLIPSFLNIRTAYDTISTSVLYQMAMTDFIWEGHLSRHIKRMRTIYQERRRALSRAISARADDLLEAVGEDAGMYLTALLPPGVDDVAVATHAAHAGIGAAVLSQCYLSPPKRGGLILPYAFSDDQVSPARIDKLKLIIRDQMLGHR